MVFALGFAAQPEAPTKLRYLRPSGAKFETECTFTFHQAKAGFFIDSLTERGKTKMRVGARYDTQDRLVRAEAALTTGDQTKTALAIVRQGKALIERDGKVAHEFDVPAGVIVTSAPDWSDTLLLCRRYDRDKKGKQSFAGLWLHPVDPSRQATFTIERTGADTIEQEGKKVALDRFTIHLRPTSAYAAWADAKGTMIKLVPLPYKDGARNWLVLEGYEKSAAALRP
jgi:hypothetical protein